ncbi:hypothetical protein [Aestuariibacter salexigens]|uniref:hypothetical protein n=1 Tax=Aestuariibacter salexigens TaxID=226010 RepID=UPI000426095B|nr:hypothetical protein [Aestuariibacter salexigens]
MSEAVVITHIRERNGSLKVTVQDAIFIAEFSGACTLRIAKAFHQSVTDAQPHLPNDGWAYLSSSQDYVAALPEVEQIYADTYRLCTHYGCLIEAYCMPSKVGLAQVDKARRACGVTSPIEKLAFNSIDDAKYYLVSTLAHIKEKRKLKQSDHAEG